MINEQGENGLEDAQLYQKKYSVAAHIVVPIVKADLNYQTGKMTYSYSDADQLIR